MNRNFVVIFCLLFSSCASLEPHKTWKTIPVHGGERRYYILSEEGKKIQERNCEASIATALSGTFIGFTSAIAGFTGGPAWLVWTFFGGYGMLGGGMFYLDKNGC